MSSPFRLSRVFCGLGLSLQICLAALADTAETSKITEVTVYGDRARVSREVTVKVPGGDSQFELTDLPGDLDENSVGITVRSGGAVIIRGLDVRREFLSENADARSLDLRKQLEKLQNQKRRTCSDLSGSTACNRPIRWASA
ncbi:MAG TPA: DUF4140 domain-containing protein [Chthoniobacterales bacterium]|nr:DUF4140 domain-containing protein [Chthoniobacterales bacterium]